MTFFLKSFFKITSSLLVAITLWAALPVVAADTETTPRIGLFIASVDPITEAHMDVIRAGIQQLNLTKVIIMVNSSSDKDYSASVNERIDLVKTALRALPVGKVDFEVMSEPAEGKKQFAINVANQEGHGMLFQIAGQDVQPKATELFGKVPEVQSYILPRINRGEVSYEGELMPGFHWLTPVRVTSISSTEVKESLENGLSVQGMLATEVLKQITQQGLYFPLNQNEGSVRGQLLAAKMRALHQDMAAAGWGGLTVPSLAKNQNFVLRSGVSATDNLSFNLIQSSAASDELIIRLISKATPGMSKSDQYEFRQWALQDFSKPSFKVLEESFAKAQAKVATKSVIIAVEKNSTVTDLLKQMKNLTVAQNLTRDLLILKDESAKDEVVSSLQEKLAASWRVAVANSSSNEAMGMMDRFLRQLKARPILIHSANSNYDLDQWNYRRASAGAGRCEAAILGAAI